MSYRMSAKAKISITLSGDLLERIDRTAQRDRQTRSGIIEQWLRLASRADAAAGLSEDTVRYYDSLTSDERAEDTAIARASSRRARRLRIDD